MTTIDRLLTEWHTRTGAVGAAACVVTTEGLTWSAGVGYADLHRKVAFDPERSIMNIASVSKLITATAVMQLVEAGRLDIDAAVDRYLAFVVKHPTYPDYAITARQLLTHTAAIADGPAYWECFTPGDSSIDLGSWLHRYFDPVGSRGSWHPDISPGQRREYSNVGFGLLGYLVEAVAGIDFRRYTKEFIFDPLGLTSTGWFLADLDTSKLASIYVEKGDEGGLLAAENGSIGRWSRLKPYGFPNYPDGLLRTTVADLGRFAAAMLGGKSSKVSVLKPETLAQMCTGMVSEGSEGIVQGLGWCKESARHPSAWGHGGSDPGVRTRLVVDFDRGYGVVFFTNCSIEVPEADALLTALETTRSL